MAVPVVTAGRPRRTVACAGGRQDGMLLDELLADLAGQGRVGKDEIRDALGRALVAAYRHRYKGCDVDIQWAGTSPEIHIRKMGSGVWEKVSDRPPDLLRKEVQVAAQVLRQQVLRARQRRVEAELERLVGESLPAEVTAPVPGGWGVELRLECGVANGFMAAVECAQPERLVPGQRVWVLVTGVQRGPQPVVVSQRDRRLALRLLELHVPEVADGAVEIMGVARAPGELCKVAVRSRRPGLDPVAAVVGVQGQRQKAVSADLGESLEVARWSAHPEELIASSLAPARVARVELRKGDGVLPEAVVWVPAPEQLALALGRGGVRARLAERLCGCSRLTLKVENEREEEEAG